MKYLRDIHVINFLALGFVLVISLKLPVAKPPAKFLLWQLQISTRPLFSQFPVHFPCFKLFGFWERGECHTYCHMIKHAHKKHSIRRKPL